ncbi:hypothetical protein [Streptomyces pilosus]|uniref:Uncharacterized protein n=1 Tax=Streptomyces pilosus TaxID=28893 RepID=A0A918C4Y8_9ACTN|nr:hypothetical protein [Streptomyces pilosus]GGR04019.1 hypothetical protein GCM10010280_60150 [Streptomyces pilosus]GGV69772.1 hypothetical protein GCM10010261_64550 [Streptomyces pilosus]
MNYGSTAFLLLVLAVAVLSAAVAAMISFGLARWEGASIPAALSRSGVAFAAALTLCLAVLASLNR